MLPQSTIWQHFNINVLVQYLDVKNIYVFVQIPNSNQKKLLHNWEIDENSIEEADENFIEESNKNESSFDFYDI